MGIVLYNMKEHISALGTYLHFLFPNWLQWMTQEVHIAYTEDDWTQIWILFILHYGNFQPLLLEDQL